MLEQRFWVSTAKRRSSGLATLALCSALVVACKKKPSVPAAEPQVDEAVTIAGASGSATPSAGPVPSRCREDMSKSFIIGEAAKVSQPTDDDADAGPDDDDEVPAPFSVELGEARAQGDHFTLSALRSYSGRTHALLALLPADAASGKIIDLGAVYGDPDPPAFALHGGDAVLAVSDGDAGGGMLRLGRVQDVQGAAHISWGREITGVRRDSTFALEMSGDRGLLVYAAEAAGVVRVYGVAVDPANLKANPAPAVLSVSGADVDSPRLVARQGGYWLAVARAVDEPKAPSKVKGADAGLDAVSGEESLLDLGTRQIELRKLDGQGKPVSAPLVVTAPGARPMTFELAAAADGGAYLAFRDDDSSPGMDGGALQVVHVKSDGTFQKLLLDGDTNGTGSPSLLVDAADPGKMWLTAPGENGATWFGRVTDQPVLAADSTVRGADIVAIQNGQFLLARSQGTAAELSVASCHD